MGTRVDARGQTGSGERARRGKPPGGGGTGDRAIAAVALCACVLWIGCEDSSARGGSWRTVRQAVGDTVIVRTIGVEVTSAVAAVTEELSIGVLDGEDVYMFGQVGALAVSDEGRVYAFDRQVPALRVYGPDGSYVHTMGRKGSGPGEYAGGNGLALLSSGQTLLYDAWNGRVNVYSPAGAAAGEWRVPQGAPPMILEAFVASALTVDGADNVYVTTMLGSPGVARFGALQYSSSGEPINTIEPPDYGYEQPVLTAESQGRRATAVVAYAPAVHWAVTSRGDLAAGLSSEYRIDVRRGDGTVLRIEKDHEAVPVSAQERVERADEVAWRMRRTEPGWRWNGPSVPDRKPYFRGIQASADGRIWVMLHEPSEPDPAARRATERPAGPPVAAWSEPAVYDVFDSDGEYVGRVPVPPRTTFLVMRGDQAWGITRDTLDVEYVRRYRIDFPRRISAGRR